MKNSIYFRLIIAGRLLTTFYDLFYLCKLRTPVSGLSVLGQNIEQQIIVMSGKLYLFKEIFTSFKMMSRLGYSDKTELSFVGLRSFIVDV